MSLVHDICDIANQLPTTTYAAEHTANATGWRDGGNGSTSPIPPQVCFLLKFSIIYVLNLYISTTDYMFRRDKEAVALLVGSKYISNGPPPLPSSKRETEGDFQPP